MKYRHHITDYLSFIIVPVAIFTLISSKSHAKDSGDTGDKQKDPSVMVGHRGNSFGEKIPEWVSMDEGIIEDSASHDVPAFADLENKFVFIVEIEAPDMKESRTRIDSLIACRTAAEKLAERVRIKYPFPKDDDSSFASRLYEEICETTLGDVRIEDRWWFRFKNTSTGDEIISYRLLFSAPKDAVTAALRTALVKVKDKTPEEKNRKAEITAWVESGLPGLPSVPKELRKAK